MLRPRSAGFARIVFRRCATALLLFAVAFAVCIHSPVNAWSVTDSGVDSGVFRYMALVMSEGGTPYVDAFDHKGPLLYIINWLGMQLAYMRGVWFLELAAVWCLACAAYKIARITCGRAASVLVAVMTMMLLPEWFDGGNRVEEYALPFIGWSLWVFIEYLRDGRVGKARLILCGASFAAVVFLRANMAAAWLVLGAAVAWKLIRRAGARELLRLFGWFLVGAALVAAPLVFWLGAQGALGGFVDDYIVFNMLYTSPEGGRAGNGAKLESFLHFASYAPLVLSALLMGYLAYRDEHGGLYMAYLAYLLLTPLFICMSGMQYPHYGMVIVPAVAFPLACIGNAAENQSNSIHSASLAAMAYLLVVSTVPTALSSVENAAEAYRDRGISYSEQLSSAVDVVLSSTEQGDEISVYGNWCDVYVVSHRLSCSQYSYQSPIGTIVDPGILDSYYADLDRSMPKAIVVQSGRMDSRMESFIDEHGYRELWAEDGGGARVYGAPSPPRPTR